VISHRYDCFLCKQKKKKAPRLWYVLYTVKNQAMPYLQGSQARNLRHVLMQHTPRNAKIVDHKFYSEEILKQQGWVMCWEVTCDHLANFPKINNIREEELLMIG
jgi:hypothetical protein